MGVVRLADPNEVPSNERPYLVHVDDTTVLIMNFRRRQTSGAV
jgi:hypothetical protein